MDKQQILEIAKRDPRFSKAILTLENQIGDMPITSKQLDELVQLLEFALNNPDKYPQIVESAVKDDMLEEGDLPASRLITPLSVPSSLNRLSKIYQYCRSLHHQHRSFHNQCARPE